MEYWGQTTISFEVIGDRPQISSLRHVFGGGAKVCSLPPTA
jgi:hypothetical protein